MTSRISVNPTFHHLAGTDPRHLAHFLVRNVFQRAATFGDELSPLSKKNLPPTEFY
jgi:hypothetical protein